MEVLMPFKSEKQRRYLFANEPEVAKKFAKDYNMGGVASMFRKRLAEGDDPFYEAWKKVYETNPDAAALNEKHDEYLQKYKLEMSMQTRDAPMEETEETTEVVEETTDPLLNLFQPSDTLASDQAMTTLFTPERPTGIMTAANGGKAMKKIKGQDHMLAYITPKEADKLIALGGQETMTKEGIPAYPERDNYGFSSQEDFDSGDVSKSNDPNVRGEGPGQDRVTASELAEINRLEEKYDDPKDQFSFTPKGIKNRTDLKVAQAKDKYNKTKKEIEDKFKSSVKKKAIGSLIAGKVSFGITDVFGALYSGYQLDKNKKEYETTITEAIDTYRELGIPEFSPHTDTAIQTLGQELIDINKKQDKDDTERDDREVIDPITLEVDEQYAEGDSFNFKSALDKIRQNQAVRSGLVEKGIIQDNEPMLANKGGLAGLFRVKNQ
jgi:hypothetical protein